MSKITLEPNASGAGTFTLAAPNSNTNRTLTLPDEAGKVLSTGNNDPAEVFKQSNILGTVSESGGVPTGAIIERGSNSNGEFVKYADGTLICYGEIVAPSGTGTGEKNRDWTFPVSFVDTNRKVFCNFRFRNHENMRRVKFLHPNNTATTESVQRIGWEEGAWVNTQLGTPQAIMLQAIGRWY